MQSNSYIKLIKIFLAQFLYLLFPARIVFFFFDIFTIAKKKKEVLNTPSNVALNIFGNKFVMHLEKDSHQNAGYIETSKGESIYEETMIFCLSNILSKTKKVIFLDIGSYISYYGLFVSSFTKDEGIIYAIESNPNYIEISERSKKHNKYKNIINANIILSDKCEEYLVHNLTVIKKKYLISYKEQTKLYDKYEKKELDDILENGIAFQSTTLDKLL